MFIENKAIFSQINQVNLLTKDWISYSCILWWKCLSHLVLDIDILINWYIPYSMSLLYTDPWSYNLQAYKAYYWITLCFRRSCFCCSQIWRTRHRHIVIFTRSNLMDSKGCQPFKKHICHVLKPFYGQWNIGKIVRSKVIFLPSFPGRFGSVAIRQWPLTPVLVQQIYGVILWAVMAPI